MSEPFYLRQTAEDMSPEEQRRWVEAEVANAKAQGAVWFRVTKHPQHENVVLVEAWKKRPSDEGEPRFREII